MILDTVENLPQYFSINKGFEKVYAFIQQQNIAELSVGKYEIDGDNVFAIVAKEKGRSKQEALLETHENYIDIQLVLDGIDEMGWSPKTECKNIKMKYDAEKDVQLYSDEPNAWIKTTAGKFVIFVPQDAHMPMVSDKVLHKIVFKVKVSQQNV